MTNKQIIIDGYNVSECLFYQSNFEEDHDVKIKHFCSNWHNSCESANNSNCYFKQLARKTQECEDLKERLVKTEEDLKYQCVDCMNVKSDRYRKALEEIEEKITALHCITIPFHRGITHELADIVQEYKNQILDIIDKAKGEGICQ